MINNTYAKWTLFIFSQFFLFVYVCTLFQALLYFWGSAAMPQGDNNGGLNRGFVCFSAFVETFMDEKYVYDKDDEYFETLSLRWMWAIKLGDQLIFISNAILQIFVIVISQKTKVDDNKLSLVVNDEI